LASITVRNLDDAPKGRLRVRAAEHGRLMEEEACEILRQVIGHRSGPVNLGQAIHFRFAPLGNVKLPVPERAMMRPAPELD
jgi:plasmid stability protein